MVINNADNIPVCFFDAYIAWFINNIILWCRRGIPFARSLERMQCAEVEMPELLTSSRGLEFKHSIVISKYHTPLRFHR